MRAAEATFVALLGSHHAPHGGQRISGRGRSWRRARWLGQQVSQETWPILPLLWQTINFGCSPLCTSSSLTHFGCQFWHDGNDASPLPSSVQFSPIFISQSLQPCAKELAGLFRTVVEVAEATLFQAEDVALRRVA